MQQQFRRVISGEACGPGGTLARAGLTVLEGPYRCATALRNALYDARILRAHRATVPVVSVGNLTLGGTGKTPMVAYVARRLLERGRRVAILSRGYGADRGPNDEAMVLARHLPDVPHLQHPNRVRSARRAVDEHGADVLVLDDAFQHRRLARDLDLVLVDATQPFGYGRVFPRGLLREPLTSLRRADLLVLTRSDQCSPDDLARIRKTVQRRVPAARWVVTRHRVTGLVSAGGAQQPTTDLADTGVLAVAGIGNPGAFRSTLERLGARILDWVELDDHHRYTDGDVAMLGERAAQHGCRLVVTTEKDLVKIDHDELAGIPLRAVRIEVDVVEGGDLLDRALDHVLGARRF